jgi:dTDP-4-amino-4,6-dideoxygalactose transaminase
MIPFAPPYIDEEMIQAVADTLRSGWITTGPKTKLFEKELAAYCGVKEVIALNSATAGLEIMLRWFGVKEGDEVIVPAYTYSATANVVVHCGAKPIFVDIDPFTFNMDPKAVQKAISPRTKVIMPVDFGGLPANYPAFYEIVNQETIKKLFIPQSENQRTLGRIMLLADAAHSFGASINEKKTGSWADCSVFSFHAVKNLTTAEGGAVALHFDENFNNRHIYEQLCISTLHGQNKDALAKMKKGNWKYDIVEAGYKSNMTDINASLGLVQLKKYDSFLMPQRKAVCDYYSNRLKEVDGLRLPLFQYTEAENHFQSSYHLFPLILEKASMEQRDAIIQKMAEKEVASNVHFLPVPATSFYRNLGYSMDDYPLAQKNFEQEISLPVFSMMTPDQMKMVMDVFLEVYFEVMH